LFGKVPLLQERPGVEVLDADAEGVAGEAAFGSFFVELVPNGGFAGVFAVSFYVDLVAVPVVA